MHAELIEAMKQAEREAWAKAGWGEPPKKPDWWAKDAACVLALLAAAGRLVPEGCKLIPTDGPTREMRWATWEAQYRHINATHGHHADEDTIRALTERRVDDPQQEAQDRAAYRAMLAAAPRAENQA